MLIILLGLGALVLLGRRSTTPTGAAPSPSTPSPVVGRSQGGIPGMRLDAPVSPTAPLSHSSTPGGSLPLAPPSGIPGFTVAPGSSLPGGFTFTSEQPPPKVEPPPAPTNSGPPVAAPGEPTIPGTTLPIPTTLPESLPPWGLNKNGCDMGEGALGLSVQFAMLGTEGSSDLNQAVTLERFAQQIAFCKRNMDYATKLGQRAAEIRARAGGAT